MEEEHEEQEEDGELEEQQEEEGPPQAFSEVGGEEARLLDGVRDGEEEADDPLETEAEQLVSDFAARNKYWV